MRAADRIELGPAPRANLLPPEVHRDATAKRGRRLMVYLVVLVLVVVVGGYAAASLAAVVQQAQLSAAQARTQELMNERLAYGEVTALTSLIDTIEVAREQATASEVVWARPVGDILRLLPAGSSIKTIDALARLPWEGELLLTGPLREARTATLVLTTVSPSIPDGVAIVRAAEKLEWVADISIDRVEALEGGYHVTFTINLTEDALELRFVEDPDDSEGTEEGGSDD